MNILSIIDNRKANFKKSDFELVYYGKQIADKFSGKCTALVIGDNANAGVLGKFGAGEIYTIPYSGQFDNSSHVNYLRLLHHYLSLSSFASLISEAATKIDADLVILPFDSTGKSLLGSVAVRLNASSVSGVINIPEKDGDGLVFKKGTFSSKAYSYIKALKPKVVITLMSNTLSPVEVGDTISVSNLDISVPELQTKVLEVQKAQGKVPLTEADIIVSGGRGMKGPENWGVLLDLAEALGASTACSRPVSDVDWRPHSEHVGQTGIVVRPNLYIALGISGAIQHLAGVNNSKCIVIINKDPEAPFFKAADYGVVGDLFDIVPRLTEAIKQLKSSH